MPISKQFSMEKNSCMLSVLSSSFWFPLKIIFYWNERKKKRKLVCDGKEGLRTLSSFRASLVLLAVSFHLKLLRRDLFCSRSITPDTPCLKVNNQRRLRGQGIHIMAPVLWTLCLLQGYPLEVIKTLSLFQVLFFCRPICKIRRWHFLHAQEQQEAQKRSIYKVFWIIE